MSFVCPRCKTESHHPEDERHGYCGVCHDFTAPAAGNLRRRMYDECGPGPAIMRHKLTDTRGDEVPDVPWKFTVLEVPKPMLNGTAYKWSFTAIGFVTGATWTAALYSHLSRHTANTIICSITAAMFIWQIIFLFREEKRLKKELERLRAEFNRLVGPELTDQESGDGSHG